LTTYFMGACVLAFANTFKERRRRTARWERQDDREAVTYDMHRQVEDPTTLVVGREHLREQLSRYKERERRIITASLAGYSQEEIVELYSEPSVRAVEGVLYRWRTQEKARLKQERLNQT